MEPWKKNTENCSRVLEVASVGKPAELRVVTRGEGEGGSGDGGPGWREGAGRGEGGKAMEWWDMRERRRGWKKVGGGREGRKVFSRRSARGSTTWARCAGRQTGGATCHKDKWADKERNLVRNNFFYKKKIENLKVEKKMPLSNPYFSCPPTCALVWSFLHPPPENYKYTSLLVILWSKEYTLKQC